MSSEYDYVTKYSKKYPVQPSPREVENIQEIRKLIREQSNLGAKQNVVKIRNDSGSSDEVEVPIKRFTPLPDIPRCDDPFYRTESKLIREKLDDNNNVKYYTEVNDQYFKYNKKERLCHFASSSTSKATYSHRLPALENHSLQNAMDLDEDLPMSNEPTKINQRLIYTSPGDRMISPIKRPQAPSPPASAYKRNQNDNSSDSESDNDFIIS